MAMTAEPRVPSDDRGLEASSASEILRFGIFELDRRSGELRRQGRRVALGDKPFQLLSALLERPGEVVLREELQSRLWPPGVHVDFDRNLNTAATNLRSALGDSASSPRFIETLPKRGYRFIAPVGGARGDAAPSRRGGWSAVLIAAALGIALAFGWFAWRDSSLPTTDDGDRRLLAVMPFEDLGPETGATYLSDGLTEELIAELGRLRPERLGVIARMSSMSYKGTDKRVDQIADELGADYLVEGSLRRFDGRIRVVVQLVRADDQTRLWSTTFEEASEDILGVQIDLAARAAEALAATLFPDQPAVTAHEHTRDPAAFDAYLQGRYEWNRFDGEGYLAAVEHLERAVEIDPDYALAWAGLADAHNLLAFDEYAPAERFPRAREAAERALEIDPDLAEGHNALAFGLLYWNFDVAAADSSFAHALELSPNLAMAHHWRAGALAASRRHDEAITAMQRAVELDPRSLSVLSDLGWYFLFADRYDEAITECRRTLGLREDYGWASLCLFEAHHARGDFASAVGTETVRLRQQGAPSEWLDSLAGMEPTAALQAIFRYHLDPLLAAPADADPIAVAHLLARTGDSAGALEWLERAYRDRNGWVLFLDVDPRFDSLHGMRRFEALVTEIRASADGPA